MRAGDDGGLPYLSLLTSALMNGFNARHAARGRHENETMTAALLGVVSWPVSLLMSLLGAWLLYLVLNWAIFQAVFRPDAQACQAIGHAGLAGVWWSRRLAQFCWDWTRQTIWVACL